MAWRAQLVASGLGHPADIVCEDENTFYYCDISGGAVRKLTVDAPPPTGSPETNPNASVTTYLGGLVRPVFLARAFTSGRMVVTCMGADNNAPHPVLEVPSGAVAAVSCARSEFANGVNPHILRGPMGVALSPDGAQLFVLETQYLWITSWTSPQLTVINNGVNEVMWFGSTWPGGEPGFPFSNDFMSALSEPTFLKIQDPEGTHVWIPGESDHPLTRVSVNARGLVRPDYGWASPNDTWAYFGNKVWNLGFARTNAAFTTGQPRWGAYTTGSGARRFIKPGPNGPYTTFGFRESIPSVYNVRGIAMAPSGTVYLTCADFSLGNNLFLGAANNPGSIWRIWDVLYPPPDYVETSDVDSVYATGFDLKYGINSPVNSDDFPTQQWGSSGPITSS